MKIDAAAFRRLVASRRYEPASCDACITHDYGDGWLEIDTSHAAYPRRKPGPTLFQKAANFAAAAAQHIAAGAPMASEADVQRRHDICTACPHFDGKACGKCGCPVNRERTWLSKLSWADQSCPDDPPRWGPVSG